MACDINDKKGNNLHLHRKDDSKTSKDAVSVLAPYIWDTVCLLAPWWLPLTTTAVSTTSRYESSYYEDKV